MAGPRGESVLKKLETISISLIATRYPSLEAAEEQAIIKYASLMKAQAELAAKKNEAMLELIDAPYAESFRENWQDETTSLLGGMAGAIQDVSSSLQTTQAFVNRAEFIADIVGITPDRLLAINSGKDLLDDTTEIVDGLASKINAAVDLFTVFSDPDKANLSNKDTLLAIKKVFDAATALGPGGPFISVIAPFLTFYSDALGASAEAIEQIERMIKDRILAIGDCDAISVIVDVKFANDAKVRKELVDACKLRELMERIRDP